MKEVILSRDMVAWVDDEDYEYVSKFKWQAIKARHTYYAQRTFRMPDGKTGYESMHRAINRTPRGYLTDHIDGNGLNNQKSNLRTVTSRQNSRNRIAADTTKAGKLRFGTVDDFVTLKNGFGSQLKDYRIRHHYTQEGMALILGVHWTYVSQVERGARPPSLRIMEPFIRLMEKDHA